MFCSGYILDAINHLSEYSVSVHFCLSTIRALEKLFFKHKSRIHALTRSQGYTDKPSHEY
jgi:hypothetical protein